MNVLVTLMVTRTDAEKAEISLITQRIEEISGATDFFASCIFGKKREKFINKVRLGLTMDHWPWMPELRDIFLSLIYEEIFKNGSNII